MTKIGTLKEEGSLIKGVGNGDKGRSWAGGKEEMNSRLLGIVCVAILILTFSVNHAFAEPSQTTIEKIVSARESYDGKEVSVSGNVSSLHPVVALNSAPEFIKHLTREGRPEINLIPWINPRVVLFNNGVKLKTSKRGNDYTAFTLSGRGSLNVYPHGHSQVKEGQTVRVTGVYRKEKRVGKYTFRNEIEATDIKQE